MTTEFQFHEPLEPAVSPQPPTSTRPRLGLWHFVYVALILSLSCLAFGKWLNVIGFPHRYAREPFNYSSWGVAPGLLVIAFWSGVWVLGYRRRSLNKAFAVAILLFVLKVSCEPYFITGGREFSRGSMCKNHLKQLGLAFHRYHDKYGSFPPANVTDEHDRPMHSWRVLILPFVDQQAIYDKYNFAEPWDSPSNRALEAELRSSMFICPSSTNSAGNASYFAVIGPGTIWPGTASSAIADVTDGTDQTVMLIELHDRDVRWMEPRDISLDDAMTLLADLPARNTDGAYFNYHLLMADGSIRTRPVEAPASWWRGWFTIAGKDNVPDLTTLPQQSASDIRPVLRKEAMWSFGILTLVPLPIVWRRR